MLRIAMLTAVLYPASLVAADPKPFPWLTPADGVRLAATDIQSIPAAIRPFTRYLFIADQRAESVKLASLTLNVISRGDVIVRPVAPRTVPKWALVRVNLASYAPRIDDLNDWLRFWEELQFDPSFSRLITKDAIELLGQGGIQFASVLEVGKRKLLIKSEPYTENGQTFAEKWVDVLRLDSPNIDPKAMDDLRKATLSNAPIVEHRYFTYRVLSTIRDNGLYEAVFGGLYYQFQGIKTAKEAGKKNATDEDVFFESIGVGDVDKGLKAETVYERVRSDRRVAVFRSKVTGKPRRVDVLGTLSARDESKVFVTHDPGDADIDSSQHAMMNLANLKDKAREVIFSKPNGLQGFALFDANGARQDEAPPDVVVDHRIPEPFTRRLQGAISCLRCHGGDGSDGLKPLVNDVQRLLKSRRIDIFGDLSGDNAKLPVSDVLSRLAGQYAGSPDTTLRRIREDYLGAQLRATGPYRDAGDQTGIVKITSDAYADLWQKYWYDAVDTRQALREHGVEVEPTNAVKMFREMVPPDRGSRVAGVLIEDVRIAALAEGLPINRIDFALAQSFIATRMKQQAERVKQEK